MCFGLIKKELKLIEFKLLKICSRIPDSGNRSKHEKDVKQVFKDSEETKDAQKLKTILNFAKTKLFFLKVTFPDITVNVEDEERVRLQQEYGIKSAEPKSSTMNNHTQVSSLSPEELEKKAKEELPILMEYYQKMGRDDEGLSQAEISRMKLAPDLSDEEFQRQSMKLIDRLKIQGEALSKGFDDIFKEKERIQALEAKYFPKKIITPEMMEARKKELQEEQATLKKRYESSEDFKELMRDRDAVKQIEDEKAKDVDFEMTMGSTGIPRIRWRKEPPADIKAIVEDEDKFLDQMEDIVAGKKTTEEVYNEIEREEFEKFTNKNNLQAASLNDKESVPESEDNKQGGTYVWRDGKLMKGEAKKRRMAEFLNWYCSNADPEDIRKHRELLDRQHYRGPVWDGIRPHSITEDEKLEYPVVPEELHPSIKDPDRKGKKEWEVVVR